jgi:hypothetical protein
VPAPKELEALQQSLVGPIREAEAVLARLEGERDAMAEFAGFFRLLTVESKARGAQQGPRYHKA